MHSATKGAKAPPAGRIAGLFVASCLSAYPLALPIAAAAQALPPSPAGVSVSVDAASGSYIIKEASSGWTFAGRVGGGRLTNVRTGNGLDALGAYHLVTFDWTGPDGPKSGSLREYVQSPTVLFSVTAKTAETQWTDAFPAFTSFPNTVHTFSYTDSVFSPAHFGLRSNATPYLLFDDQRNAAVLSPASNFFLARMNGDLKTNLTSGLNLTVRNLPAGFTHQTLLYFGSGIGATLHNWGETFTNLLGRKRPASDADLMLKYFGYWTDNGADYYYNYDLSKGYAATLVELVQRYRAEGIPIHYLQLDSWWYEKSYTSPSGKVGNGSKNKNLPVGTWNAYGGTLQYRASPALFPKGLAAFHKEVGLPLAVHARWIDPASPYHKDYQISGVAPVDPKWWDETAAYLKDSGVICYEQDWLNEIYLNSPAIPTTPGAGDAFTDNMARAAGHNGEDLQYCMALPRYFLNGARYDNLTTIRVSGDRFERSKYDHFLYTSTLADAMGIWPWVDVFKSAERDNLLLATLSAGPVGIGDAMGLESKPAILHAVRADGRIVKPDAPLLPTDSSFLADARAAHAPLVGYTFTHHAGGPRTVYLFGFTRKSDVGTQAELPLPELDLKSAQAYVYDYFAGMGKLVDTEAVLPWQLSRGGDIYCVAAPVGPSGIALLGDLDNFVSCGAMRIPEAKDTAAGLTVTVALAPEEKSATITGWAPAAPVATASEGRCGAVQYDAATQRFTVTVEPAIEPKPHELDGDPVRFTTISLKLPAR